MKHKMKFFCLLLILNINITGCHYFTQGNAETSMGEMEELVNESNEKLVETGKATEGEHYFIISKNWNRLSSIPARYALELHYRLRTQTLGVDKESNQYVPRREIDYFSYEVYSIDTGRRIKTIDVNELFQKEFSGYQLFRTFSFKPRAYQGKPCVMFYLQKQPSTFEEGLEPDEYKQAYLDIETGEVWITDYSQEQLKQERNEAPLFERELAIFFDDDYRLLKLNGIEGVIITYSKYWEGTAVISLPITFLPDENKQLYAMFPRLKEQAKEAKQQEWESEDEVPHVAIYLVDSPTAEEIIGLLLPEGQKISFEGMGISERESIDGKNHEVHSFEEYLQYLKPIKNPMDEADIHPIFKSVE